MKTYMQMAPHQQRVMDEKTELDQRLSKLSAFVNGSDIFNGLDQEEQRRLTRQLAAMTEYSLILGERIENF